MAKKVISLEAGTVSFDFSKDKLANGEAGPVLAISASQVPGFGTVTGVALHALLHGVSQKVGDSYANAKNQSNPVDWAVKQVQDVIASIIGGVWNAGRTGEGATRVSILARAMHRIKVAAGEPSTEAEAQALVDSLTKEQVAEYKSKKKIARMLETIRVEDATARLERAKAKAAAGESDEEDDEGDAE